jgi:thiazole/oxazole-forming peptide maturase SagC family component
MLARLQDTAVYQQFAQATARRPAANGSWAAPQLHVLAALAVSEGYLYSSIGMTRLCGRILSVFLPLIEIQAQDLLRVPYCPACGHVSKAQMEEMYTSTRRLVGDMLSRITVEG